MGCLRDTGVEKEAGTNLCLRRSPILGVPLPFSSDLSAERRRMVPMHGYWLRRRKSNRKAYAVAALLIAIAFSCGIIIGNAFSPKRAVIYGNDSAGEGEGRIVFEPLKYELLFTVESSSTATIRLPAVDNDDNGVVTLLTVQVIPGSGRILTDIDKLIFWVDTQNSIRKATAVAENVTGINVSRYDIIYTVHANASVIGGPSAGAAITMATIAALQNRSINQSVMITGTINHDGTIGPVGGIYEKALASRDVGAEMFLVPMTQSTQVTYKEREYCEKIGWMDFCTQETYPVKVDIEKDAGIKVKEIMNVQEAMDYMLVEKR